MEMSTFFKKSVGPPELYLAAKAGDLDRVKQLLGQISSDDVPDGARNPAVDINERSEDFPTAPLHAAVKSIDAPGENENVSFVEIKREELVEYLLSKPGIDVNLKDGGGCTPLILAARRERCNLKIFRLFYENKKVDKEATNQQGEDALMCAATVGHEEIVQYLLPKIPNLERKNEQGNTALTLAAGEGRLRIVKMLTEDSARRKSVRINEKSKNSETLLMLACQSGNAELVRYILQTNWNEKIDINSRDCSDKTALMLAADYGYTEIVKELCDNGADVTPVDKDKGHNALMLASIKGHHKVVDVLLYQGKTDITVTDHLGRHALFLANNEQRRECIRVIMECKRFSGIVDAQARALVEPGDDVKALLADPGRRASLFAHEPLFSAAERGDKDEVKKLLHPQEGEPADINVTSTYFPYTALYAAIHSSGNVETEIKEERDKKKRLELKKRRQKYEDLVKYLLKHKDLEVNRTTTEGDTPLILAAKNGSVHILKALCEAKGLQMGCVQMDKVDTYGNNAFMAAAEVGNLKAVKYLLKHHLSKSFTLHQNLVKRNEQGYTAIHLATGNGHLPIVEVLGKGLPNKVVDSTGKTEDGKTILMLAALSGSVDMVEFWLKFQSPGVYKEHININATDINGNTALMLASEKGSVEIVTLFCQHKDVDVNMSEKDKGYNALMLACINGHYETALVLLNNEDTDIKATDQLGRNVLFLAVEECPKFVEDVIQHEKFKQCMGPLVHAFTKTGDKTALTVTDDDDLKLELIKAGGYDVRSIPAHQEVLRRHVRQVVVAGGEGLWKTILDHHADIVLPVLAMMAETKDVKETDKFWAFVSKEDSDRKYLSGNKVDRKGNTFFHYLARSKCVEMWRKYLPWDQRELAEILGKQNDQENTLLHEAAMSGCLKDVFTIVQEKVQNKKHLSLHSIRDAVWKKNDDQQTFLAFALITNTEEKDIIGILDNLQKHPIGSVTFREISRSLLHAAVKRSKSEIVEYLAKKPTDADVGNNQAGFNPLHIAVSENNCKMFGDLLKKFPININDPTGEKETVLHIAAKQGNVELLEEIVKRGGDLSRQDIDGHTPLHDCLQQVYLEGGSTIDNRCKKFTNIWKKIVDVAVIWWCGPCCLDVFVPDEGSKLYQDYKRQAVYCLRSLIRNEEGFTILQYAAHLGLVDCVTAMLTLEHVFVRRKKYREHDEDKGEFEIEITDLSPEYEADFSAYLKVPKDLKVKDQYRERKTTFVETLAEVKPPMKASQVLQCVPMFRITKWQWKIYQWFGIVWLICHLTIMIYASVRAQNEVNYSPTKHPVIVSATEASTNSTNETVLIGSSIGSVFRTVTQIDLDRLLPLYATGIFVMLTLIPFYLRVRRIIEQWRKRKLRKGRTHFTQLIASLCNEPTYKVYHEFTKDKAIVLNVLTRLVGILVFYMKGINATLFCIFAWWQYGLKSGENIEEYTWVKGVSLLIGWLLLLVPAKTYSKIYNFLSSLQSIIIKDMLPFMLFYFVITVAFSCAMQLQFQLLSTDNVSEGEPVKGLESIFSSVDKVLYELIVATAGLESDLRNVQDITDRFLEDCLSSTFIRLLLMAYAILSVIVLLNMLIAMMGTTMSIAMQEEGTGWRQYQVSQTLWIRDFLIWMKLLKNKIPGCRLGCCRGRRKCRRNIAYSSISQHVHLNSRLTNQTEVLSHPKRRSCLDRFLQKKTKVRKDDSTNGWYLTLTKLELNQIRARYWQPICVEDVRKPKDRPEVFSQHKSNKDEPSDIVPQENYAEPALGIENRMSKMENKLENMQNVLDQIHQMLSEVEK